MIQNNSQEAKLEKMLNIHDFLYFKECIAYIQRQGQKRYGKHFRVKKNDYEMIHKLLVYSTGDELNCKIHNIDLQKGILLLGPVGCGKTSLMNLIKLFNSEKNQYSIIPSREVSFEFTNDGYSTIIKYGKSSKIYCFDDLGVEKSLKHFGNDCNTMAEILLSRYDKFIYSGILTHATTNLNAHELENLYGNRVRSRLREMFNLIAFDKAIPDKRS
jgi:DNA replication protein DnaC